MRQSRICVVLHGICLVIACPEALDEAIRPYFAHLPAGDPAEAAATLGLCPTSDGRLDLCNDDRPIWPGLDWPGALHPIFDEIGRVLAAAALRPLLRAAAVGLDGAAVLIAGPPGCGKTSLAAWLAGRGFAFLADDLVGLGTPDGATLRPVPLALCPHGRVSPFILAWPAFAEAAVALGRERTFLMPPAMAEAEELSCALLLVPQHHPGSPLVIEPVPADRRRFTLELAAHPDQPPSGAHTAQLAAFARQVPAFRVRYGTFDELAGGLDGLDGFVRRALAAGPQAAWASWQAANAGTLGGRAPSAPALAGPRKRLSVGMATFDDYDGVYFTLQALRLYHPEVADDVEFLVVDNNPDGSCGEALRRLGRNAGSLRYIPVAESIGTAVRDVVMREASGEFVLCLDCHVLVVPGALARLLRHFEDHPGCSDLLQGPLVNDDLKTLSTHWKPEWAGGMYGTWALDEAGMGPDAPPFDIPMQGLGLYACRRAAWPGYNSRFRGFGGEEGYIHEKFRQAGGRTLCLPFLRWLHRFDRPLGTPYAISWHDRIRNYMIGFDELGLPLDDMLAHFREHVGPGAEAIILQVRQEFEGPH